jgi:hypothetical protein
MLFNMSLVKVHELVPTAGTSVIRFDGALSDFSGYPLAWSLFPLLYQRFTHTKLYMTNWQVL